MFEGKEKRNKIQNLSPFDIKYDKLSKMSYRREVLSLYRQALRLSKQMEEPVVQKKVWWIDELQ